MKHSLYALIGAAILGTGPGVPAIAGSQTRPNILLITVDDMNYNTPGCFGGPPDLTPNIDRLAAEGMRFERAHVALAICQASRQSLMTGRYPHNAGYRWFEPVADGVPVLPEILHEQGYLNACFGKAEHLQPRARYRWAESRDLVEIHWGRNPAEYRQLCRDFIARADEAGKPFFLMANSHDPHRPFHGASDEVRILESARRQGGTIATPSRVYRPEEAMPLGFLPDIPEVRLQTAQYMSSVRRADDTVGEILRVLDETGHRENTLVIFLSDNGSAFPFAKGNVYLNSTRTPFIVRWPGRVAAGTVNREAYINGVDFMPTILEALGLPVPDGTDGRSWLPLAGGRTQPGRDSTVTTFYNTYPVEGGKKPEQTVWFQMRALHSGRYGYIYNGWAQGKRFFTPLGTPEILMQMKAMGFDERVGFFRQRVPEELYDFETDPDGLVNLADDPTHRDLLGRMRTELLSWMKAHRDTDLLPEYEAVVRDGGVTERTPFGAGYLGPVATGVRKEVRPPVWWHQYTTVATDPERKTLDQIRRINADTWRAAGWYGGWYGFWFADMLEKHTDVPARWDRVIQSGSRPMMYYDAGEVGDFVTLVDDARRQLVLDGWHWEKWSGQAGTVRWYGLDAFMSDPAWAPYATAQHYGLPPFSYPDGRDIAPGDLYSVLTTRDLSNQWSFMSFTNPAILDAQARDSGLAAVSSKQQMGPEVQQGSGWVIGRLVSQDHTNPQLREFQRREIDFTIRRFKPWGVHVDNFGDTDVWQVGQSFGLWTVHTYRDFLKRRFSREQLAALGVADVDTFDIREYVATAYAQEGLPESKRLRDSRWLDDVLFRSHVINKIERSREFWQEIYYAGRKAMQETGIEGPIFGNTIPLLPGGGFMKGICDIAHFEWKTVGAFPAMPEMGLPPRARIAYMSRLGQKIGNVSYCWPSLYVPKAYSGPGHENLHKVLAFDCLANRGILDYNHWYLDSYSPGTDESAGYLNTFIRSVAPALSGREYRADVGLVYCPWSNVASIDAFGLRPEMFLNEYKGWCDFLGNVHAQWDVLLSQDLSLAHLRRFKVVVLPSVLVLTEPQVAVLKQYLATGGRVVATGETGVFFGPDGFLVHRPASLLESLAGRNGMAITPARPGVDYLASGWENASELKRLLKAALPEPSLVTDAPETVGVNSSVLGEGENLQLTVDLNNYACDPETDNLVTAAACEVALELPQELRGRRLEIVYADPERQDGMVWQAFPADAWRTDERGETLHLTVPSFRYYVVVSVRARAANVAAVRGG